MAFKSPILNNDQRANLKPIVARLQEALQHVFLVVPLSNAERKKTRTFVKTAGMSGAMLYDSFVDSFRPQLAEVTIAAEDPFGLKKLVVPLQDVPDGSAPFLVDAKNYFFRRGAQTTDHPAWTGGDGRPGINSTNNTTDGQWLAPHRGKNFVVELRNNLRTLCAFQNQNWRLINAFVRFVFLCTNKGKVPGFHKIAEDTALPAGLAERLLDYFYLGRRESPELIQDIDLAFQTDWKWMVEGQDTAFRENFPKLANNFRLALRGEALCYDDNADWPKHIQEAIKGLGGKNSPFSAAQKSLEIILEMLPSRALPQEALAWIIEELCELACGTKDPTKESQFEAVAEAIRNGKGADIAAPLAASLPAAERETFKKELMDKLDAIVQILGDSFLDDAKKTAKIGDLLGQTKGAALLNDKGFLDLIEILMPKGSTTVAPEALAKGAQIYFKVLFQSRVAPRLFGSSVVTLEDLLTRLKGDNYGLMLAAIALNKKKGDGNVELARIATEGRSRISDSLQGNNFQQDREAILQDLIVAYCKILGADSAELKRYVELFNEAQALLEFNTEGSAETIVSSLMALRPLDSSGAISKSKTLLTEALVKRMVHRKAAALTAYATAKNAETAAKEKVKEAEKTDSNTQSKTLEAGEQRELKQEAQTRLENARLASKAARDNAIYSGAPQALKSAKAKTAAGASAQSVPGKVDEIFKNLGLALPADEKTEFRPAKDLSTQEQIVERVMNEYRNNPAEIGAVDNLLKAYENLNHLVYDVYAAKKNEQNEIAFCRQVEAMTLGRIIAATGQRCGLGGATSGMLKLILDMIQETGSADPSGRNIEATELLKSHSLHEYLDGGYLQKGQPINSLRVDLQMAARSSFENITSFISELQAIQYLFHGAPEGSIITIFNGTSGEFISWLNATHLKGHGPFSIQNGEGLPGIVYLSKQGGGVSQGSFTLRNNQMGYLLPPVVTCPALPFDCLPFSTFAVGPDFPLNLDGEMTTEIPAPYPVLVAFLNNRKSASRLNPNINGNEFTPGEREFNVAGVGAGVDPTINAVFKQKKGTFSFPADYHLYLVLRLYADCFLQAGGQRGAWEAGDAGFFNHWHHNPGDNLWSSLNENPAEIDGDEISIKEAFPGGSARSFCFNGDISTKLAKGDGIGLFSSPDNLEGKKSEFDCQWFITAIQDILPKTP